MQFTWNERIYKHDVSPYIVDSVEGKSSLHQRAYSIVKQLFKFEPVLQELPCFGTRLHLDLFLPSKRLGIECQGRQHYECNSFFHKSKTEFVRGTVNDKLKKLWCEQNDIILICLDYRESDDEWTRRIIEGATAG